MLSKKERQAKARERRSKNLKDLQDEISWLKGFCGIGGDYSTAEIVLIAAGRLDYTVNATIHPNQHVKNLYKIAKKSQEKRLSTIRTKKDFYSSRLWKILRYQAFEKYGNSCQCCGATAKDVAIHVDHIHPRSTHPHLELDLNNLQILCEDCNSGKINQWDTSWIGT